MRYLQLTAGILFVLFCMHQNAGARDISKLYHKGINWSIFSGHMTETSVRAYACVIANDKGLSLMYSHSEGWALIIIPAIANDQATNTGMTDIAIKIDRNATMKLKAHYVAATYRIILDKRGNTIGQLTMGKKLFVVAKNLAAIVDLSGLKEAYDISIKCQKELMPPNNY